MAAPAVTKVRRPLWVVGYEGRDISEDIRADVIRVTFTDSLTDKSPSVEVELADGAGLWRGPWFPRKGDKLTLAMGYEGEGLIDCGEFEVDNPRVQFDDATVAIRGLGVGVTKALKTAETRGYDDQTLREIAEGVAGRHGLVLQGDVPNQKFARVTQSEEGDLPFLKRLAADFGLVVTVRGRTLVFHEKGRIEARLPVFTVTPEQVVRGGGYLESVARRVYRACEVRYHDPSANAEIAYTETAEGRAEGDVLRIQRRVESPAQAAAIAKAQLARANADDAKGKIPLVGEPVLVAGNKVNLVGFGALSGEYVIVEAVHEQWGRMGYKTEIDVRRKV